MAKARGRGGKSPRSILINQKISASTQGQYASRRKTFLSFAEGMNATPDKETFFAFLLAQQQAGASKCTAESFRCALLHQQHVDGGHTWAGDADVIQACKGFRYVQTDPPRRGAVTPTMLSQLLTWMDTQPRYVAMKDAVEVAFGAALRASELVAIKSGDLRGSTLMNISNKAYSAKTCHKTGRTYNKCLSDERALAILGRRQSRTQLGALLFPSHEGNLAELREMFKVARTALNWDPQLTWDGPHTLRHGGTGEILARLGPTATPAELAGATGMSPKMRTWYGAPNDQRK
jgi:integrase